LRRGFALDEAFEALKLLVEHPVDPRRPLLHPAADVAADDIALREAGAALDRLTAGAGVVTVAKSYSWPHRSCARVRRASRPAHVAGGPRPAPASISDHQADIAKVQEWVGHANIATTRIYDHRKTQPEDSPTFKVNY
jgi:hypothetical protein